MRASAASYQLEEAPIGFGTAVEDRDFKAAIRTLEEQDLNPQTEAMWDELAGLALDDEDLATAERCFAALGNIAKSRLRASKRTLLAFQKTGQDGMQHWAVRSMLAQLRGDYTRAERIFVKQGQVEEAIEMYQTLHRWDDAIKVAEQASHPEVEQMKTDYFAYLRDSGQEERAAELKAAEGDYVTAINLYLKGGYPARAAQIVKQHDVRSGGQQLLERIANDMTRAGMHERAGEFYEMLDQLDRAVSFVGMPAPHPPSFLLLYLLATVLTSSPLHFLSIFSLNSTLKAVPIARRWSSLAGRSQTESYGWKLVGATGLSSRSGLIKRSTITLRLASMRRRFVRPSIPHSGPRRRSLLRTR